METEQEKVAALQRIFTSPSMKKQMILEILRDNGGSFDKAFEVLLQMNQDEEDESASTQRKISQKLTEAEKKTRIRELQTMFGGDMTQSLIQDVVATHPDSLESAVEELLNITSEEVAYNRRPVGLEEERKRQEEELRHYEEWKITHEKTQEELRKREEEERKLLVEKAKKEESERAAERERLIKLQQERRQQVEQEKIKKMEEKLKLELEKLQVAEVQRLKKQEEEKAKKDAERLAVERARMEEEHARMLELQKMEQELKAEAQREEQQREAERERLIAQQRDLRLKQEQLKARQEEEKLRLELARLEAQEEERLRKIREEVELRLKRVREEGEERLRKIKEDEEKERQELAKKEEEAIELARIKNLREEEEMRKRVEERLLSEKARVSEPVKDEQEDREVEKAKVEDESFQTSFAPVSPSAPRHTAIISINAQADEINGTWTLEEAMPSSSDWVGLFPSHQPSNYKYTQSIYVNSTSPLVSSGNFTFKGVKPGRYVAKFFRGKSYVPVAETARVLVGPKVVSLQANVAGDSVEVRYALEPASAYPTYDWIGIYEKDRRNKRYMVSTYGNKEGVVTLRAPRTPGLYEARLFVNTSQYNEQEVTSFVVADNDNISIVEPPNASSASVDASSPLTLSPGTPVTVSYVTRTVEPSTSDWIGVYPVEQVNNKAYLESRYTLGTSTGTITFTTPTTAGVFEFRLFVYSLGKYVVYRRSRPFEVVVDTK